MTRSKVRADKLVVEQGLAPTRTRAQALILAGAVCTLDGKRIDKAGTPLDPEVELRLKGQPIPYVSRGGLKLAKALEHFGVSPQGRICLDVGASTGGFTDCLLQGGAEKVYAVDVGYNQLAWSLRQDPRVVSLERTNIRTMPPDMIPEPVSLIVADVSFISLQLILEPAFKVAEAGAEVVMLVKPQFEVGRAEVGKGGIVRNEEARQGALEKMIQVFHDYQLDAVEWMDSPIQGAKGNHEFLLKGVLPKG